MNTHASTEGFVLDLLDSPVGALSVVTDADGAIAAMEFEGYDDRLARLLRRRHGIDASTIRRAAAPRAVRDAVAAYFDGELVALDALAVRPSGTPFQREVWSALRRIPAGSTLGYGELARRVGRPGASRAVGLANGSNPVVLVQPCHRVIGADGSLTGFGGGIERKRWLLEFEARWAGTRGAEARGESLALFPAVDRQRCSAQEDLESSPAAAPDSPTPAASVEPP